MYLRLLVPLILLGLARATLAHADWQQANGPEPAFATAVARTGSTLILGAGESDAGDAFRSVDGGTTWSNAGVPNGGVTTIFASDGSTFLGAYLSGLYRSTDAGMTWEHLSNGLGLVQTPGALTELDGTIFVGAENFSPAPIHRSTDGGDTWTAIDSGPLIACSSMAALGGVVFAGTREDGLYRSLDGGDNWFPANNGLPADATIDALDSVGGTLLAGVHVRLDPQELGVFASTDLGVTWTRVSMDLPAAVELAFTRLTHDGATLFAGLDGPFGGNGLYRSTNDGVNWTHISGNLPVEDHVLDVRVEGGLALVCTPAGVYATTDAGTTWLDRSQGTAAIRGVASLLDIEGTLFVGLQTSGGLGRGVWRTTDAGTSWLAPPPSLPSNATARALLRDGDRVYAGMYGAARGIFVSTDGGDSWTDSSSGIASATILNCLARHEGSLFAGAFEALYRSTDAGVNWSADVSMDEVQDLEQLGAELYAGRYGDGVFRTTDGGMTWEPINAGLASSSARTINALGTLDGTLYAATNGAGVFRLANDSWEPTGLTSGFIYDILSVEGVLVAADALDGIHVSADHGATWSPFESGFFGGETFVLAVDAEHLWAGTRGHSLWLRSLSELPGSASVGPATVPAATTVARIAPNPLRQRATLSFDLARGGMISLVLYDVLGRRVATLVEGARVAGPQSLPIDAGALPDGVYFFRLTTPDGEKAGRLLLTR